MWSTFVPWTGRTCSGAPSAAAWKPLLCKEIVCLSQWNAVLHFHQVLNKPKADDWVCVAHFWSCRSRDVSSLTVEQSGCEGINSLIYFLLFFSFIEQHATATETNGNCAAVSCWGFLRRESSKCDLGLGGGGGGVGSSTESTTTSRAISQDEWLGSRCGMILFALTLCHFTVY